MTTISRPAQSAPTIEYPSVRFDTLTIRLPGEPMLVSIEYGPSGVVASDRHLGLFGEGKTLAKAVVDLIQHMTLTLRDLEAHEQSLSPELVTDLKRLRFFLRG